MFGTPSSTPAFGTPSSTPAFGNPSSTPAFGTPTSTPAFGTPSFTSAFSTPSTTPAFGTPSAFSTPTSTPALGSASTPAFGGVTPSSTPAFGAVPTPSPSPLPLFQSQPQQQQSPFSIFPQQQQQSPFSIFPQQPQQPQTQSSPFGGVQITTQMAPVAPLPLSLTDRDIQAIMDAYREDPGNPKYAFRHLLFSVTEPAARVKPVGASDIMWAEAMAKLEGMDSTDRERLWPQLVQGFRDLSTRLQLQDEVMVSDAERLKMTQTNVKMLQRHLQADTLPWIERLRQKEQELQRRLLKVMRIVEALEFKGLRVPLMKGEAELAEKLSSILKQLKGPQAELSRRVHNLQSLCRVQANVGGTYLPESGKIDEQSIVDLQEVLQQQTEAIARLGSVLKRDIRDTQIIMSEGSEVE